MSCSRASALRPRSPSPLCSSCSAAGGAPAARPGRRRARLRRADVRRPRPRASRASSTSSSSRAAMRVVAERPRARGAVPRHPLSSSRSGGEQGLLSLAFHPRYAQNHLFYVDYTDANGDTRVVEYRSDGTRADPVARRGSCSSRSSRSRTTTAASSRSARTACSTSAWATAAPAATRTTTARPSTTKLAKLWKIDVAHAGRAAGARRVRPAQPVALLVRPRERRPLHRRRRPGDVGGDRLRPARPSSAAANFGWAVYEGRAPYDRSTDARPARARTSGRSRSTRTRSAARSPAASSTAGRPSDLVGRYFYGDYCSGTVWSLKVVKGRATGAAARAVHDPGADVVRRGRPRRALRGLRARPALPDRGLAGARDAGPAARPAPRAA